jgi:hypothetical protein
MSDLLDLPRHVHKAGGEYLLVKSVPEYDAALADGWLPMPPLTPEQEAERYALQVAAGEIVEPKVPSKPKVPKPPPAAPKWGFKK